MRRSPLDGEILRLAAPALGALAAEPLYLLVDTAIVGHLGTTQLAALALAASILSTLTGLCIFLTYGTTAQVARLHGAGEERRAGQLAAQALWLALAIGLAIAVVCIALAGPIIHLIGGQRRVQPSSPSATCGSRRAGASARAHRPRADRGICAGSGTCGRRSSSSPPPRS